MFEEVLYRIYGATAKRYNIIVEGSRDVRLLHLAANLERKQSGIDLLHDLSVFSPGEGEKGGAYNIPNVYRTLQTIARGDIDSKGNVQYYVFVLVDNDYAGRNVIKYLEKDALKAIECRDIFCINPIMPKDVNPHYEHIKKSLERENAPYKGLDWEMEDYISDRIWKIFINDECANDPLLCKPKVCHDKIHRNLNDIQKGRFYDIINNSACYEDIENIVHLIKTLRIYLKIDRV